MQRFWRSHDDSVGTTRQKPLPSEQFDLNVSRVGRLIFSASFFPHGVFASRVQRLALPSSVPIIYQIGTNKMLACGNQIVLILLLFFSVSVVSSFVRVDAVRSSSTSPTPQDSTTTLFAERTTSRRPWNIVRFFQQSSRFVSPFPSTTQKKKIAAGDIIWKAGAAASSNDFTLAPLDDVVMGGASSSTFDAATGKWTGEVTDANNGGFIGIRSTPFVEYDMSKCTGIQLKVTPGDRKALRLKVVIRDSTDFNGIGWTTSVNIDGKGSTVKIPFKKQVPTRFAQTVSGPSFGADRVRGVQLVFSKFEYDGALNPKFRSGDFSLQVEEVRTY